ncbi:hypothetical protein LMG24076_04708 [Trinickia soli]|nr:hypothetical protein LMG24076_04708 [Trinickia soli]
MSTRGCRCRRFGRRAPIGLEQLIKRQVHDVATTLGADEYLRGVRIYFAHGFQVHPLAYDGRRFRVLSVDLFEALGVSLRLRFDALCVRLRVVDRTLRLFFRTRQDLPRIGLRRTLGTRVLLAGPRGVRVGALHRRRRLDGLHGDARHGKPRASPVERALNGLRERLANRVAVAVEQALRAARADGLSHRRLRRLRHAEIGIDRLEQVIGSRFDLILHGHADIDDTTVLRDHGCILHVGIAHCIAAADLDRTDLRDIDDFVGFKRIGQTDMDTRLHRSPVFAELQDDTGLALLHDEDAAADIDRREHADDNADADSSRSSVVRTPIPRPASLAFTAEKARQAPIEIAPHFVEIGRTAAVAIVAAGATLRLVRPLPATVTVAAPPTGIVDRKNGARTQPETPLVVFVHLFVRSSWEGRSMQIRAPCPRIRRVGVFALMTWQRFFRLRSPAIWEMF